MTVGAESADPDVPLLPAGSAERLHSRAARGVLWNIVGTVFNQGSTFVVNLILANLWGLKTFGEYAMVQSTVAVVASMSQFATGYTATKYVAEFRSINPDRTGRVLALCGLVAVFVVGLVVSALVLGADLLAGRMLGEPSLAPIIRISAVAIGFSVLAAFLTGALAGFEQYAAFARAGIIAGLVYVASCSIGAWMAGLAGAVVGQGFSTAIFVLVLFKELRRVTIRSGVRVRLAEGLAELRILVRFALPAALNNLVALPAIWLANATLVRQLRGYEEMALFTAANGFRIIVLFLPNIVNNVGMSLLNHQRGASSEGRYRRVFWANLVVTFAVVSSAAALFALCSPWLLTLFGEQFKAGRQVMLVLLMATLPEAVALATVQTIQSQERMWLILFCRVIPCYATLLGLSQLLIPGLGAVGLAWAYLAAWSLALLADVTIIGRIGVWENREPASA